MLQNYLIIAFRNFYRHLGYSAINVFGLAIGLATSILISLWVIDELRVDTDFPEHQRIYQILYNSTFSDGHIETSEGTAGPLAAAITAEIPEVEAAGRWDDPSPKLLRFGNKSFLQKGLWTDPGILKVFSIKILKGSNEGLLKDPNSFIITQRTAEKFFQNEDPIGKTFKVDEKYEMTVSAVIENPPSSSSKQFDFLLPYDVHYKENPWMEVWGNFNDQTYIKIKDNVNVDELNNKLKEFVKSKCDRCYNQPFAQQLGEKHLNDHYENGKPNGGRIDYIKMFIVTSVFILIIACINYMNLATARSANRSREVGVRKVTGARRSQLIIQFVSESLLITSVSVVFALVLVQLALPFFNGILGKNIVVDFSKPSFLFSLVGLLIIISIVAGSYPAFFLSSFRPASVLKGQLQSALAGASFRKGLVVFQFSLSVVLIMASLVVFEQTQFIMSKNLGFNRENILIFDMHDGVSGNQQSFKNEALKFSGIHSITFAGQNPFSVGGMTTDLTWLGKNENEKVPFKLIFTDKDFIPTMKMELKEGSNFTDDTADTTHYIINEAAVKRLGYKQPIGAPLNIWNSPSGKIIGVVKDFHNVNLHSTIDPLIIMCRTDNTWRGFVKIENGSLKEAISHLEATQKKFDPAYPFEYEFMDKSFEKEYSNESTIKKLSVVFTVVAILISGLGLFALASFMAERRTKEIGIRKVLGATVWQVAVLLSNDFLKLLAIAFLVGTPLTWIGANQWLITFAYHINLTLAIPLVAGGVLLLTALTSVCYQSIKAATSNPVESLKNE
jgi:putative ABC transport system permease protein